MTWSKAGLCCSQRNMVLYTPEHDEDGENGVLAKALRNISSIINRKSGAFWSSGFAGKNKDGAFNYVWQVKTQTEESSEHPSHCLAVQHQEDDSGDFE